MSFRVSTGPLAFALLLLVAAPALPSCALDAADEHELAASSPAPLISVSPSPSASSSPSPSGSSSPGPITPPGTCTTCDWCPSFDAALAETEPYHLPGPIPDPSTVSCRAFVAACRAAGVDGPLALKLYIAYKHGWRGVGPGCFALQAVCAELPYPNNNNCFALLKGIGC